MVNISWGSGPGFPDLIKGGAMGTVNGFIVHAGGCSFPWREHETGWWLNPKEGEWKPLPPMPEGRVYTSGITVDNSFYVVGGRKRTSGQFGNIHKNCWRLSRKDNVWHWDILPELHHARGVPALAAVDNVIYCIGGGSWGTGTFLADSVPFDEYLDLKLETGWREMPMYPERRRAGAYTASANGKIYVFGGYYSWSEEGQRKGKRLCDAWCFDPEAWKWIKIAQLPVSGMSGGVAVVYQDRYIILLGGAVAKEQGGIEITYEEDQKRGVRIGWYNRRVLVYDVRKDSYEELSEPLPYATNDIRAAILEDTIYAIGGENIDSSVSNTCAYVRVGKIQ